MFRLRPLLIFLLLLVICTAAFWDIATFQDSLKWDMVDCYFPWRYFVGESIHNGVFPLWNPYQHLGYPIHADLRSVFYPEAFAVGLFGGYTLWLLNILFILNITIAGTGIYRLTGLFANSRYARFAAAVSYLLSGFFVGHGQEMFGIIAATWIPWVLFYFIRLQRTSAWEDVWKLAFFLFLLLTGGYQALSMMLFYLLLFLFAAQQAVNYRKAGWPIVRKTLKLHLVLGAVVALSCAVLLITYVQVAPFVERLGGMSIQDAYKESLTWRALLSWVLPYSVSADASWVGMDLSMANMYVGLMMLMAFSTGLFSKKDGSVTVIWMFGAVCLLAAMGPLTPVRKWLYGLIPMMDLFRMSSFFSYFTQLAVVLLGAIGLDKLLSDPEKGLKKLWPAMGSLALFIIVIGVWAFVRNGTGLSVSCHHLWAHLFNQGAANNYERAMLQAAWQLILLGAFSAALLQARKRKGLLAGIIVMFVLVDMGVALRLNYPVTVGGGYALAPIQQVLNRQPQGFPIPDLRIPLAENTDSKPELEPLWHNTNIFTRTVSADGFNSFRLDRFENYGTDRPQLFDRCLQQPLLFLSVLPVSPADSSGHPDVHTSDGIPSLSIVPPSDSTRLGEIAISEFSPEEIVCTVNLTTAKMITLQQTYYQGWRIHVDGAAQKMVLGNGIFPSVRLDKGRHTVRFSYQNRPVILGFCISYLMFALIICVMLFFWLRNKRNLPGKLSIIITFLIAVPVFLFLMFKWFSAEPMSTQRVADYHQLNSLLAPVLADSTNARLFLQVDSPDLFDSISGNSWSGNTAYTRSLRNADYTRLGNTLRSLKTERMIYAGSNLPEDRTAIELMQQEFPTRRSFRQGRAYVHVFDRQGERKPIFSSLNDLDTENLQWNYRKEQFDTASEAHSGLFGWVISEKQMGSPALAVRIGDVTDEVRLKAVFTVYCKVLANSSRDAGMYIQLERDHEAIWHRAQNLSKCALDDSTWFKVSMIAEPDIDLRSDDVLRMFVWGSTGGPLFIDDLEFGLYQQD